ncbi:EAL domain-containing protein [Cyanobacterium stanieri LEGE 03274]|uniref:EAL domain-containing protein n=1 Tax=Cyanobacterium stanieri LEGE 03274 TaxID=1828756 RepID=A0ABR9UZV8_9CHRO|nr:EAL domain-containing protein [Cyanobacterium stanieri]MBE9221147.1 EAL domain-containing protein [Cyanobacterium stanieri LEGE 03274]
MKVNVSRYLKHLKYIVLLVIWLSLIFLEQGNIAQEISNNLKAINVGVYQNSPKVFIDENGNPQGFWVDIIDEIARINNWSIVYVPCRWERCLNLVEANELDLMVDVAYSPERDRTFTFNNNVVLASWSEVYTRPGLELNSIFDLDGKTIGILKSSIQQEVLEKEIQAFGIFPRLVKVDSFEDIFILLENREIDAGIVNNFLGRKNLLEYNISRTNILINPARLHFITPKGDPKNILPELDLTLEKLMDNSDSIYYQARSRWLEPEKIFGWQDIPELLINSLIYIPFFALIFLALWNYFLKKEVARRKIVEQNLQESKNSYINLTNSIPVGVFRTDKDFNCLYVNEYCCQLMGLSAEKIKTEGWLNGIHPEDREKTIHWTNSIKKGVNFDIEYRFQRPDKSIVWVFGQCLPEYDRHNQLKGYIGTVTNISDRILIEQQLKHNAFHDKLTGLANRDLLTQRLELAIQKQKRNSQIQFAVLFLDLDNFKVINDSLGHSTGDKLLISMAKLLQDFIRETDIAARLGGDEFVILLEDIATIQEAITVAQRIIQALESPFTLDNKNVFIKTSIGITTGSAEDEKAENILRDADIAMYRAKQRGKGKYAIFDPIMHSQVVERLQMENDLRHALDNQEFILNYQPIVNLESSVIEGFEALIRWQHPKKGLISPFKFISITEEMGLIIPLGQWILKTGCQQLSTWQKQFNYPLKLSINLSVKQLNNSLITTLDEILSEYEILPNTLSLEITESMLIENLESTFYLLHQVKERNISISIDDFGTGYSCFSYLHRLPVDILKIDRSFVHNLEFNHHNQLITESIIVLSKSIGMSVIAEGVEAVEQKNWLKQHGCSWGQGYFFSPPLLPLQATMVLEKGSYQEYINNKQI